MTETVVIDCFPSSVARYVDDHAIVAVDVIRATTMAVTPPAFLSGSPGSRARWSVFMR